MAVVVVAGHVEGQNQDGLLIDIERVLPMSTIGAAYSHQHHLHRHNSLQPAEPRINDALRAVPMARLRALCPWHAVPHGPSDPSDAHNTSHTTHSASHSASLGSSEWQGRRVNGVVTWVPRVVGQCANNKADDDDDDNNNNNNNEDEDSTDDRMEVTFRRSAARISNDVALAVRLPPLGPVDCDRLDEPRRSYIGMLRLDSSFRNPSSIECMASYFNINPRRSFIRPYVLLADRLFGAKRLIAYLL
jgi:hypothetical protein